MRKHVNIVWLVLALMVAGASATAQTTTVTNSNNGTTDTVPMYTGSSTLGNSPISVSGGNVGIGATSPNGGTLTVTSGNNSGNLGGVTAYSAVVKADNGGGARTGIGYYASAPSDGAHPSGDYYPFLQYGLYVDHLFGYYGEDAQNTYGIYVAGGGQNYFSGSVGIGTPAPNAPLTVVSIGGGPGSGSPTVSAVTGNNNPSWGGGGGVAISAISRASDAGGARSGYALYAAAPYDGSNASGGTYAFTSVGLFVDDIYGYYGKNAAQTYGVYASGGGQNYFGGSVGIGTTSPSQKLEVVGSIQVDGSIVFPNGGGTQSVAWTGSLCGGDYAESIDVSDDRKNYEPGDVLVIDPHVEGKFLKASEAYSRTVAGIYSTKPGVVGRRQTTTKSPDEISMAVIGIVPAKVSAENGAIHPGDMLVTSSVLGYAMKGTDYSRMFGAVIGKAMGSLDSGKGVIEILVTLQ